MRHKSESAETARSRRTSPEFERAESGVAFLGVLGDAENPPYAPAQARERRRAGRRMGPLIIHRVVLCRTAARPLNSRALLNHR